MKTNDSKDFNQEANELSYNLLKVINELSPQKVYVSSWKGVDDILDNVSGVSVINEQGKVITQVVLVQLDCHNNYLKLAKNIAERAVLELKSTGFEVIVKSTIED